MGVPSDESVSRDASMDALKFSYSFEGSHSRNHIPNILIFMWVPSDESMPRHAPKQTFECFYFSVGSHS